MLCNNARVVPCNCFVCLSSFGRFTVTTFSSTWISIKEENVRVKEPLGPLTVTSFPAATSTVTPAGTVISLFPIRDITFYPPIYLLPNVSNNFST